MERRLYEHIIFVSCLAIATVLFQNTIIMTAILSKKMFNWQLNKIIPSCMCKYNF